MTGSCVLHLPVCMSFVVVPANNAGNHAASRAMQGPGLQLPVCTLSPCTMSSKGTVRFLPVASSTKPVACT